MMLSSSSNSPPDGTRHVMAIASLLEPRPSSSSPTDNATQHASPYTPGPLPSLDPPCVLDYDSADMLLPPLHKEPFHAGSSGRSASWSPPPDPRDIGSSSSTGGSLEERRRRNKIASQRYRAKRSQENKNMRQAIERLRQQNAVLLQALNDAYRDKNCSADAQPPSSSGPPNGNETTHCTTCPAYPYSSYSSTL